jgi:phage protein D
MIRTESVVACSKTSKTWPFETNYHVLSQRGFYVEAVDASVCDARPSTVRLPYYVLHLEPRVPLANLPKRGQILPVFHGYDDSNKVLLQTQVVVKIAEKCFLNATDS